MRRGAPTMSSSPGYERWRRFLADRVDFVERPAGRRCINRAAPTSIHRLYAVHCIRSGRTLAVQPVEFRVRDDGGFSRRF